MSEKRTVVDVVMIHLHCDKCNQRMELNRQLETNIYKCPNCGYESASKKLYPYTEYQTKTGF